jgi:hypothetical protein
MKTVPISSVEIDSSGGLLVRPETCKSYEYLYREANGLRWDRERHAIPAHEPARWEAEDLTKHIARTLRDSCDEELVLTDTTSWIGISNQLRNDLTRALAEG